MEAEWASCDFKKKFGNAKKIVIYGEVKSPKDLSNICRSKIVLSCRSYSFVFIQAYSCCCCKHFCHLGG